MTDDKSVEAQSHELQKVAHEIISEAMISEINLIGTSEGWWVDCGATIHVCYDQSMFKTYTVTFEDKKVLLGNHHTTNVAGIGNVELKFTSGKTMILKYVMHTPEMRKNLVLGYLLNKARIPKSKSKTSPFEIMKNKPPNLSYFRSWGCFAYVRIHDPKRIKLASRAYECVFIGYALNSKAYRFFDLKSHVILESNDADFYEHKYPFKSTNSEGASSSNLPLIRVNKNHDDLDSEPIRNADMWQEAINDKMESLESNRTWHLVDLPPGCKMIGCKWVLKKKLKLDGTVDKFKARLVGKGFKQRENVDFFDTYSPVTKITSIYVLIAHKL
ncbi:retrovirus-related pol polyprotein from transposon TNT 1-94 [Tanacetum coccineum]